MTTPFFPALVYCSSPDREHSGRHFGIEEWLRLLPRPLPPSFLLAVKEHVDVHRQMMDALVSMKVRLPRLLSSGQDQIFVLDRQQPMVAFFGHWPEYSAGGVRVRSIAKTLGISVETVRHHVKTMFRKTAAHSQEELVRLFDTGESS